MTQSAVSQQTAVGDGTGSVSCFTAGDGFSFDAGASRHEKAKNLIVEMEELKDELRRGEKMSWQTEDRERPGHSKKLLPEVVSYVTAYPKVSVLRFGGPGIELVNPSLIQDDLGAVSSRRGRAGMFGEIDDRPFLLSVRRKANGVP